MEAIKQNIYHALKFWDFERAKKIYEQHDLSCEKLQTEYILFLLSIGELERLDKVFDSDKLKFSVAILDGANQIDIGKLRLEIKNILNKKNIETDISHFKYRNYYVNYVLKQYIDSSSLTSDLAVELFERYIIKHNSLIAKGYFISNVLRYFYNVSDFDFVQRLKFNLTSFMENHFYELPIYKAYVDIIHKHLEKNIKQKASTKKVAVLISGIFRGDWEYYYSQIEKNIIQPLNADSFVFSWDKVALWPGLCGGGGNWISRIATDLKDNAPQEILTQEGFDKYFPNVYAKLSQEYLTDLEESKIKCTRKIIYSEDLFLSELKNKIDFAGSIKSDHKLEFMSKYKTNIAKQFFGLSKCIALMKQYEIENGFKYDYVVRVRPDFEYTVQNIAYLTDDLKDDDIAIRSNNGGLNDLGYYGKRSAMVKFLSIWDSLDFFLKIVDKQSFHGALYYWSIVNNLKVTKPLSIAIQTKQQIFIPEFGHELNLDLLNLNSDKKLKPQKHLFEDFFTKFYGYYRPMFANENRNKRYLALCLYGHLRTYLDTYKNLFKNIIKSNEEDGYKIHIFLHTWDKWNSIKGVAGPRAEWNKTFNEKPLEEHEQLEMLLNYQPANYLVESMDVQNGKHISMDRALNLALKYAEKHNIKYDYFIFTRPDIMFINPFKLSFYLKYYKTDNVLHDLKLPKEHIFFGSNIFRRMPIADPRYVNEYDLFWISSVPKLPRVSNDKSVLYIPINYKLHTDFFLWRETNIGKDIDPLVELKESQINIVHEDNEIILDNKKMEVLNLKQSLINYKIQDIEQSIALKKAKFKKLQYQLHSDWFICLYDLYSINAVERIYSHLSYQIGNVILDNMKFKKIFTIPYKIFRVKKQYDKFYDEYNTRIQKSLIVAFNPLDKYQDYQQAIKIKNGLRYNLGKLFLLSYKKWYKGGLFVFVFKAIRLYYKDKIK
ncbi:hypothetical protein [Campylobacter coli]|uniref:hypothetical protein n=1 Tax=Campylobacter coli TaxID=195 RepID=UPI0011A6ADAB|nr:hypothetical protein [Campylobacter coli]